MVRFAFGDLIGEDGTGCLIAQRGGAANVETVPGDAGVVALKLNKPLKFMGLCAAVYMYLLVVGSGGRTRTGMRLPSADFESAVSTISPLRQSCYL